MGKEWSDLMRNHENQAHRNLNAVRYLKLHMLQGNESSAQ